MTLLDGYRDRSSSGLRCATVRRAGCDGVVRSVDVARAEEDPLILSPRCVVEFEAAEYESVSLVRTAKTVPMSEVRYSRS